MDVFDIKSEFALSVFQMEPDLLSVNCDGRFRRGYAPDLIEYNASKGDVVVGYPSIRHLVPEGLFFDEEFLREASNDQEEQKRRVELLKSKKEMWQSFFKAFDTVLYREDYRLHLQVYDLERQRDIQLATLLTGIDIDREHDGYVRQLACLSLNASLKGNVDVLGFYVGKILHEHVEVEKRKLTPDTDHKSVLYNVVRFTVIIEGLSTTEYRRRMEEYDLFFNFLQWWFLPFDCDCEYAIKERNHPFVLGSGLTLDYNTQF